MFELCNNVTFMFAISTCYEKDYTLPKVELERVEHVEYVRDRVFNWKGFIAWFQQIYHFKSVKQNI